MKVGFIQPATRTGETGYAKYLQEGLLKRRVKIQPITSSFFRKPNIRIFLGSLVLRGFTNPEKMDIMHNLDNLGPYLLPNNTPVRRVLTVHDIAPVVLPHLYSSLVRFNFKNILPVLIRNSDAVIVPSRATKQDLVRYFSIPPGKVEVIPLGIDTTYFYPRHRDERVLKKYGIKGEYLIYVGTDNPRKNLKNLILAFSQLPNQLDLDLVLVGPIHKGNLMKSVPDMGERIIFPGYVDEPDLPVLYSASEALILPSLYEGFGLPLLESMACGTPVIASNNSAITEVVGDAGVLIPDPENPPMISRAIQKLCENEDLRLELTRKGLERVNNFTWDNTVNKTLQLYQDLL